jgi:hypothetical protein
LAKEISLEMSGSKISINLNYVRARQVSPVVHAPSASQNYDGGRALAIIEADVKDLKSALNRLEPFVSRIDERTNNLPTKSDLIHSRSSVVLELSKKATKVTVWTSGVLLAVIATAAITLANVYSVDLAALLPHAAFKSDQPR